MNRQALADFLKRRRDSLNPEDVGLSAGRRRRTTGLRREEVAGLAHMSTDFYARLEQQRGARPSEQTINALTQALKLTRDEEDHLLALAGHTPPTRARLRVDHASPSLQLVLDQLETPAMIVSELYVTLSQNAMAIALLGSQAHFEGHSRNLIYRWFTDATSRSIVPSDDHGEHSRTYVAALRGAYGRLEDDPHAHDLVSVLLKESEEFAALWERHEVARRPLTRKRFVHPLVGLITLDCQILTSENLAERLVVFTAFQTEDQQKLDQLKALSGGHEPWGRA